MQGIKVNGRTQNIEVPCEACGMEFSTHPANCGPWLMFCDECQESFDNAAEDVFESALWEATR